jgi:hypothetical protein
MSSPTSTNSSNPSLALIRVEELLSIVHINLSYANEHVEEFRKTGLLPHYKIHSTVDYLRHSLCAMQEIQNYALGFEPPKQG